MWRLLPGVSADLAAPTPDQRGATPAVRLPVGVFGRDEPIQPDVRQAGLLRGLGLLCAPGRRAGVPCVGRSAPWPSRPSRQRSAGAAPRGVSAPPSGARRHRSPTARSPGGDVSRRSRTPRIAMGNSPPGRGSPARRRVDAPGLAGRARDRQSNGSQPTRRRCSAMTCPAATTRSALAVRRTAPPARPRRRGHDRAGGRPASGRGETPARSSQRTRRTAP
jgi:hypothetical protein